MLRNSIEAGESGRGLAAPEQARQVRYWAKALGAAISKQGEQVPGFDTARLRETFA